MMKYEAISTRSWGRHLTPMAQDNSPENNQMPHQLPAQSLVEETRLLHRSGERG